MHVHIYYIHAVGCVRAFLAFDFGFEMHSLPNWLFIKNEFIAFHTCQKYKINDSFFFLFLLLVAKKPFELFLFILHQYSYGWIFFSAIRLYTYQCEILHFHLSLINRTFIHCNNNDHNYSTCFFWFFFRFGCEICT